MRIERMRAIALAVDPSVLIGSPEFAAAEGGPDHVRCTVHLSKRGAGGGGFYSFGIAYGDGGRRGPPLWRDHPREAMAERAEAEALRRAFPDQLGSIYTPNEPAGPLAGTDVGAAIAVTAVDGYADDAVAASPGERPRLA
jgi:hypothetical protein